MATVDVQQQSVAAKTRRQSGYPLAGARFDLLATLLAVWVIVGVFVDVNAHNHGQVDDTFFTPWHFLLYSGVAVNGLLFGIAGFEMTATQVFDFAILADNDEIQTVQDLEGIPVPFDHPLHEKSCLTSRLKRI